MKNFDSLTQAVAVYIGIAAGFAFLVGLYIGSKAN